MTGEDAHLEAEYEDRQNGGIDVDEEEDEEEYDWELEERKKELMELMERHPDMAFTGDSVQNFLYDGGDLESAGEEDPYRGEY